MHILFDVNILIFMCMEAFTEKKWRPKKVVKPRGLYTTLTKGDIFVEHWQDKGKGLELLGVVNCGKLNICGKLMEAKGYLG